MRSAGQSGERALQCRLLLQHVGARGGAGREAAPGDVELPRLRARDILRRGDLRAQRGLVDGPGDDIRGERQVACLERKPLVLGLRLQSLHLAPGAAEHIECVRHVHRGGLQIVVIGAGESRNAQRGTGALLTLALHRSGDARIVAAALCGGDLVRLPQRGLRRLQGRAVRERAVDERIELGGLKQGPPLAGNVHALDEALRLAARRVGRRGCGGHLTGRDKACVLRRRRRLEVGSDRTGGEQSRHRGCERARQDALRKEILHMSNALLGRRSPLQCCNLANRPFRG